MIDFAVATCAVIAMHSTVLAVDSLRDSPLFEGFFANYMAITSLTKGFPQSCNLFLV